MSTMTNHNILLDHTWVGGRLDPEQEASFANIRKDKVLGLMYLDGGPDNLQIGPTDIPQGYFIDLLNPRYLRNPECVNAIVANIEHLKFFTVGLMEVNKETAWNYSTGIDESEFWPLFCAAVNTANEPDASGLNAEAKYIAAKMRYHELVDEDNGYTDEHYNNYNFLY